MVKIIFYLIMFIVYILNLSEGFLGLIGILSLLTFQWGNLLFCLILSAIIAIFIVGLVTIANIIKPED